MLKNYVFFWDKISEIENLNKKSEGMPVTSPHRPLAVF